MCVYIYIYSYIYLACVVDKTSVLYRDEACTRAQIDKCTRIHTYIHIYIHTYIYKYIHTYIHTRKQCSRGRGLCQVSSNASYSVTTLYIHTYTNTYIHAVCDRAWSLPGFLERFIQRYNIIHTSIYTYIHTCSVRQGVVSARFPRTLHTVLQHYTYIHIHIHTYMQCATERGLCQVSSNASYSVTTRSSGCSASTLSSPP